MCKNCDICNRCKNLTTRTYDGVDFECLYDVCLKNNAQFKDHHYYTYGKKDIPCSDFEKKD